MDSGDRFHLHEWAIVTKDGDAEQGAGDLVVTERGADEFETFTLGQDGYERARGAWNGTVRHRPTAMITGRARLRSDLAALRTEPTIMEQRQHA